jgi:hypothetical protein
VSDEVGRTVVEHQVVDDRDLGRHGGASGAVKDVKEVRGRQKT